MRKFYFVRQPDHMIECSDNLPNQVNLHLIKQHHKIFYTLEEALQYQKILGVEPERVRIERNKEFRQLGIDEIYGYKNSTEGGIDMQKKTFVITVEYPDGDHIPSDEIAEVLHERMENIGEYLDANIMDGVSGRMKTTVWEFNEMKR